MHADSTAERNDLSAARAQALEEAVETLQQQITQTEIALATKSAELTDTKAANAELEARVVAAEAGANQLGDQVADMQVSFDTVDLQTLC